MYLADKQKQDAKIFKELINFASNLVLKDQTTADYYESYKSITYANSYISAIDGTMQTENGIPVFTSNELKEYNAIPDAPKYFIECFRMNSLYIGTSDKRLKEVSEASFNTNYSASTAPFRGNVYEANLYYRTIYCKYGCDPYDARLADDLSIIAYNSDLITSNINLNRFNKIFNECKTLFLRTMYNTAFEGVQPYRSFVSFFLTVMTVIRYQDEKLGDLSLYKNYSAKDIKNLFYSFGFFNDTVIPAAFKEDVARSLYKLINAKATDEAFDIVVKDIFKSDSIRLSKYVLVKEFYPEYVNDFLNPKAPYHEIVYGSDHDDNVTLKFYRIPYEIENSAEYIEKMKDELTPISFEEIADEDRFWFPNITKVIDDPDHPGMKKVVKDIDAIGKLVAEDLPFGVIETKFLSVSYKNDDLVKSSEKLALFFSLVHNVNSPALMVESQVMKDTVHIFDLMIAFVYTRAILITGGNPSNIAVGDRYSLDGTNREFKHFLEMLNETLRPHNDPLYLYDFANKRVENRIPKEGGAMDLASVVAGVEDSGGMSVENFPDRSALQGAGESFGLSQIVTMEDLLEVYKRICEYLDDSGFATRYIEQGYEYLSPDFITVNDDKSCNINYDILKQENNHLILIGDDRNREAEPDIIRTISSGDAEHLLLKYGVDEGGNYHFNRLLTFGLNNYFELKNALHIKEALVASNTDISNQRYDGEDTYLKFLSANHPEFTASIMKIIEEEAEDDMLEKIEAISSNLANEIDAVFRKYEVNDVSFGSLNSLAVAAFASSLIGFIKSITMQIRSTSDNTLEVEINEGAEDKMTMMDNLFYKDKQHRLLTDGSILEDAIDPTTGHVIFKDSPYLGHFERDIIREFDPLTIDADLEATYDYNGIIDIMRKGAIGKPTVCRTSELEGLDLAGYLESKEELFAHIVDYDGSRGIPDLPNGGFIGRHFRLATNVSSRYNQKLKDTKVNIPFRYIDVAKASDFIPDEEG